MTLPLAHIGHFLWVFYVMPVIIVIAGIMRSTRKGKQAEREELESGGGPELDDPDEEIDYLS